MPLLGKRLLRSANVLLGTLSNDNDDGNENVAKKGNLRSFKLNHVYLDPLNMSNAGEFPGVEFLSILFKFKKRKENSSSSKTSN